MSDIQPTEADREEAKRIVDLWQCACDHVEGYERIYVRLSNIRADSVKAERNRCIGKINALIDSGWLENSVSKGTIRAYLEADDPVARRG